MNHQRDHQCDHEWNPPRKVSYIASNRWQFAPLWVSQISPDSDERANGLQSLTQSNKLCKRRVLSRHHRIVTTTSACSSVVQTLFASWCALNPALLLAEHSMHFLGVTWHTHFSHKRSRVKREESPNTVFNHATNYHFSAYVQTRVNSWKNDNEKVTSQLIDVRLYYFFWGGQWPPWFSHMKSVHSTFAVPLKPKLKTGLDYRWNIRFLRRCVLYQYDADALRYSAILVTIIEDFARTSRGTHQVFGARFSSFCQLTLFFDAPLWCAVILYRKFE